MIKWQDETALHCSFSRLLRHSAIFFASNLTGKFAESFELARLSADVASLSNAHVPNKTPKVALLPTVASSAVVKAGHR